MAGTKILVDATMKLKNHLSAVHLFELINLHLEKDVVNYCKKWVVISYDSTDKNKKVSISP
jgi:hypothetical protein